VSPLLLKESSIQKKARVASEEISQLGLSRLGGPRRFLVLKGGIHRGKAWESGEKGKVVGGGISRLQQVKLLGVLVGRQKRGFPTSGVACVHSIKEALASQGEGCWNGPVGNTVGPLLGVLKHKIPPKTS